jgi:hypothetical protein
MPFRRSSLRPRCHYEDSKSGAESVANCNGTGRAFSDYESGRDRLVTRSEGAALIVKHGCDNLSGVHALLFQLLMNGCERWILECCAGNIIEARHGAILGNSLAGMAECANGAKAVRSSKATRAVNGFRMASSRHTATWNNFFRAGRTNTPAWDMATIFIPRMPISVK